MVMVTAMIQRKIGSFLRGNPKPPPSQGLDSSNFSALDNFLDPVLKNRFNIKPFSHYRNSVKKIFPFVVIEKKRLPRFLVDIDKSFLKAAPVKMKDPLNLENFRTKFTFVVLKIENELISGLKFKNFRQFLSDHDCIFIFFIQELTLNHFLRDRQESYEG